MPRPWTNEEIQLLGTKPDFEVGRLIGRPGRRVWAKRKELGIPAPPDMVQRWTEREDEIVRTQPVKAAAQLLGRTIVAVQVRRRKLGLSSKPAQVLLSMEEARRRIEVPRYSSPQEEEKVRFVAGPYTPPFVPEGGWLTCELRGRVQVGGYTDALIPWPLATGKTKQFIICGDLLRALKTESVVAVCFHFDMSHATVSLFRQKLEIERFTAGSQRLFWRSVDLARTDEAREKMSKQREGRSDLMTAEDRERLRAIQRQPKTEQWKRAMSEKWSRLYRVMGRPEEWTEEELKLIGTLPDREVARLLNRSLSAVKGKKFQLLKAAKESGVAPEAHEDGPSA